MTCQQSVANKIIIYIICNNILCMSGISFFRSNVIVSEQNKVSLQTYLNNLFNYFFYFRKNRKQKETSCLSIQCQT